MSFDFFNQNQAQPGAGPALGPNGEEILYEVKCGRIIIEGKTMRPDEGKGLLRICKATDGLCHLQYGPRSGDMPYNPDDDFIIFPMEAEMKFIPKPGCFVIKFPDDASRNMFFWSQEPSGTITDEKMTENVNAALNGENPNPASGNDGGIGAGASEQEQLLAMLGGSAGGAGGAAPQAARAQAIRAAQAAAASALAAPPGGAAAASEAVAPTPQATSAPAATPAAPAKADAPAPAAAALTGAPGGSLVSSSALMAALGNLGGGGGAPGAGAGGAPGTIDAAAMAAALAGLQQQGGGSGGTGQHRAAGPGLSDILTPESVGPLLRGEDVRSRLLQHLPEEHRSTQDLEELVRTPQFQNQLERFSHALQSGQMDLAQFGLSPGTGFSVAEFLQAIQAQVASNEDKEGGGGSGGGDDNAMKE